MVHILLRYGFLALVVGLIVTGLARQATAGDWSAWHAEPDQEPRFAYLRRKNRESQEEGKPAVIGFLERDLDRRIANRDKRRGRGKK